MELDIDLTEIKKSRGRVYFGFFALIFSGIVLAYSIFSQDWFLVFYAAFFLFMSFNHIWEGNGKSISVLFGKRYIKINPELISFKFHTLKEPDSVLWENIESIHFNPAKLLILDDNGKELSVEYGQLSYELVQKVKETITSIGGEKQVKIF